MCYNDFVDSEKEIRNEGYCVLHDKTRSWLREISS